MIELINDTNGHLFTVENTYIHNNYKYCKLCRKEQNHKWHLKTYQKNK